MGWNHQLDPPWLTQALEPKKTNHRNMPTLQGNLLQTGIEPSTGFVGFGGGEFASMLSSYVTWGWRDASTGFRGFFGWGRGVEKNFHGFWCVLFCFEKWFQRHHEKFFESHGIVIFGHTAETRQSSVVSHLFFLLDNVVREFYFDETILMVLSVNAILHSVFPFWHWVYNFRDDEQTLTHTDVKTSGRNTKH